VVAAIAIAGLATSVSASTPSSFAHILGVRLGGDEQSTRVVIDLDGPIAAPTVIRGADSSVRVDFAIAADDQRPAGRGRGLVVGWSSSLSTRGEALRFQLVGTTRIAHRFAIPPSDGNPTYRYVIDFAPQLVVPVVHPVTLVAYQPAPYVRAEPAYEPPTDVLPPYIARLSTPMVRTPATTPSRARSDRRLKVIVVDAGHGGHDSGALGATRQEKELTLAAAQALKSRLERSGHYRVVLTRDSDVFIPLETRVKITREGGADLFISLHADSAGGDASTHGASVYTLSDSGGGRVHYVLGRNEWFSKVANRTDAGTSQILLDLTQRNTRNRSAAFADLLLDRLQGKVDLLPRSHRDAGYFVLLAPDVPAALLEMGFITNPEDESRLADPLQRGRMMDGVAQAIDAYFDDGRRLAAR